jgi:ribose 5-phosphate isomerase B
MRQHVEFCPSNLPRMKVAFGSDLRSELTDALDRALLSRGCAVERIGALAVGDDEAWPSVGRSVGEAVATGRCDIGLVCCWTGTGVSIAANKVPGIRAALCTDAATADGARTWNDANVLAIGIRNTSIPIAQEMLNAFLDGRPSDDSESAAMIENLKLHDR